MRPRLLEPATSPAPRVAVVIPCLNEVVTIATVVADFQRALPEAEIYVFDNGSSDGTAAAAEAAGAIVVSSPRRGKGNVVRHASEAVDADVYLLVDGDGTYDPSVAPRLVDAIVAGDADMVVATRLSAHETGAFRRFHELGNRLVSRVISATFRVRVTDVLSGYRALSRRVMREVAFRSPGFEIETEMTLRAAARGFAIEELPAPYGARPAGSVSKLNTYTDALLIFRCIFSIAKDYRPLPFFGAIAAVLALLALVSGIGPVRDFYQTGLVYRVPRAILAVGLGTLATVSLAVGLILDTLNTYHEESLRLIQRLARGRD